MKNAKAIEQSIQKPHVDRRTLIGKKESSRLTKELILEEMPRIYYVEDEYHGGYRVGRSDWPDDVFNLVPKAEFETFKKVLDELNYPIDDKTHDE